MNKILKKAVPPKNSEKYRSMSYSVNDYSIERLDRDTDFYQLYLHIKKNKATAIKELEEFAKALAPGLAKELLSDLMVNGKAHEDYMKLRNAKLKEKVNKEIFVQNIAKKINKKEMEKFKKLFIPKTI